MTKDGVVLGVMTRELEGGIRSEEEEKQTETQPWHFLVRNKGT